MHPAFIDMIRNRFHQAHKGNVGQLMEALNELSLGGAEIELQADPSNNHQVAIVTVAGKTYVNSLRYDKGDEACMSFCMFIGIILKDLTHQELT